MGKFYDHIPEDLAVWMLKQPMFWVSSAPLSGDGHVNLSPKSTPDSFHMTSPNQVWYEDLTGSGIETISHLREPGNGRITILFQAMEGGPRLMRLFGKGKVHEVGTPEYEALIPSGKRKAGSRAVIVIDVFKIGTSCGFGVPKYKFEGHRSALEGWCESLEKADRTVDSTGGPLTVQRTPGGGENASVGAEDFIGGGMRDWWRAQNMHSLDGLPGLSPKPLEQRMEVNSFDRKSEKYASARKAPRAVEDGVETKVDKKGGALVDTKTAGAFVVGFLFAVGLVGWKEAVGSIGYRLL